MSFIIPYIKISNMSSVVCNRSQILFLVTWPVFIIITRGALHPTFEVQQKVKSVDEKSESAFHLLAQLKNRGRCPQLGKQPIKANIVRLAEVQLGSLHSSHRVDPCMLWIDLNCKLASGNISQSSSQDLDHIVTLHMWAQLPNQQPKIRPHE